MILQVHLSRHHNDCIFLETRRMLQFFSRESNGFKWNQMDCQSHRIQKICERSPSFFPKAFMKNSRSDQRDKKLPILFLLLFSIIMMMMNNKTTVEFELNFHPNIEGIHHEVCRMCHLHNCVCKDSSTERMYTNHARRSEGQGNISLDVLQNDSHQNSYPNRTCKENLE